MTFLCNTKIRPLQPEITYTFMETIYLCIIIFLFVLAVFDLMVGVSNDAVNFLNSAVGAKAASFKTILFIAGAGIFIGASLSNGMMDIALLPWHLSKCTTVIHWDWVILSTPTKPCLSSWPSLSPLPLPSFSVCWCNGWRAWCSPSTTRRT